MCPPREPDIDDFAGTPLAQLLQALSTADAPKFKRVVDALEQLERAEREFADAVLDANEAFRVRINPAVPDQQFPGS